MMAMRTTAKTIEGMDRYAQKYEDASEQHFNGLEGDQLGPESFAPEDNDEPPVRQPDVAATVESLLTRSEELKETFGAEVATVLAQTPDSEVKGPSVKGVTRSNEKVRLEYDGDARLLKDVLRCSIICATMSRLCECWTVLRELEKTGVVTILQVKNRFRSGAAEGGYRDVNVNVLFRGLVCEVQARARARARARSRGSAARQGSHWRFVFSSRAAARSHVL